MMMIHQNILRTAETEFIDAIRDHLQWDGIRSVVKQRLDVDVHENVKYIHGALTACKGQGAVRFDFDLEIKFSLFIDLDGQLLLITGPDGQEMLSDADRDTASVLPSGFPMDERTQAEVNAAAIELAEMIKQING